ncbi:hypothetical protein DERP_003293 [Dermatophagoides pteronyssinus]|uniref:Uncharacterized protein n=1 Tax=Dermatophagoides pteronyssinus TaxID=6956 RepID=A0ABQ8JJ51_DERPT|nr:hypothetical protein DERP_003293 [Dermatophagoides pteronyssinus]
MFCQMINNHQIGKKFKLSFQCGFKVIVVQNYLTVNQMKHSNDGTTEYSDSLNEHIYLRKATTTTIILTKERLAIGYLFKKIQQIKYEMK